MCGIVAVVRLRPDGPPPPEATARAMAAAIAHRGPDDAGFYADDDIALGAARLAVVDPTGGRQPAHGCVGSGVVCVYNGELYNAPELRPRLARRAHSIDDRCDTSLLPHIYEEHGAHLVHELRGMFAFAIWDARKKELLLGRDRLGIKPLFYAVTGDFVVVASEAKAIFASGLVRAAIDRDALDDLFSLGYPCPPRTMFTDVLELRPAHTLTVAAGRPLPAPQRYWRAPVPHVGAHARGSVRSLAGDLRDVLDDAVRTHLVADVPVASSLSGGLDSSVIAALAARAAPARTLTFSLAFPDAGDARYDESAHVRAVNDALGARGHAVPIDRSCAALLPEMLWHTELPLLVPGALGGLLLAARERQEGVRVALTGDGADELFGGYDVFRAAKARRLFAGPLGAAQKPLFAAAAWLAGQPRGLARLLDRSASEIDDVARAFGGVYPPWYDQWQLLDVERAALLSPDAKTAHGGHRVRPSAEPPAGFPALVRDDVAALDPLDAQIALELETRLPAWILVISDRASMAHGVEARVPFLDERVVTQALAVPPALKMRGLTEKALLRDAARGLVPAAVRRRRKQPFMTPVSAWFFAPAPAFPDALSRQALVDAGLFAPDTVLGLVRALGAAPADHVDRLRLELVLMLVLSCQLLWRAFVGGDVPRSRFPLLSRDRT